MKICTQENKIIDLSSDVLFSRVIGEPGRYEIEFYKDTHHKICRMYGTIKEARVRIGEIMH